MTIFFTYNLIFVMIVNRKTYNQQHSCSTILGVNYYFFWLAGIA
jgi:hypothetical protein